jgi:hypothetical protein
MPLLAVLWANPWRQWPQILTFFLRHEIVPRWVDRLRHDRPKEVGEGSQVGSI